MFRDSDAFIFPSRTETLGLVLLEAMASGCPVVAARSGGIPDIVTDGVNGYLFDPQGDIQEAINATFVQSSSNSLRYKNRVLRSACIKIRACSMTICKVASKS